MLAEEHEYVVNWVRNSPTVRLFTSHPPTARKWIRRGYTLEKTDVRNSEIECWHFSCPPNAISFRRVPPAIPAAKEVSVP